MSRSRAWRRWKNFTKARRKREIDLYDRIWWNYPIFNNPIKPTYFPVNYKGKYGMYDNLHQYSKNKIHCSCPICSAKTNNKNRSHVWEPVYNPTMMDKRRDDAMDADEFDFFENL